MQRRVVDVLGEDGDVVPMERVFDRPAAVRAERAAMLMIGEQRADAVGQTTRVGVHEKTIHVMPNELPRAAGEGGDHRLPAAHASNTTIPNGSFRLGTTTMSAARLRSMHSGREGDSRNTIAPAAPSWARRT